MDLFTKLFGDFLVFVYHCFDRIVICGYLTALSRPKLVVHFFREISRGGGGQQGGAEPADSHCRILDGSLRAQSRDPDRMGREGGTQGGPRAAVAAPHGEAQCLRCYFIFKSVSGARADLPHQPAESTRPRPHYRIVAHQRSLHASLLLCPRRGARTDGCAGRFLPLPDHLLYLNGHSFIDQELEAGRGSASARRTTLSSHRRRCRHRPTG